MIRAIIYDFDGTLFHTENLGGEIFEELCKKRNLNSKKSEWEKLVGMNREERFKILFPEKVAELVADFNKMYDPVFIEKIREIGDSVEAIKKFSQKYKLFVLSTRYNYLLKNALDEFGLSNYFVDIFGYESFENKKPSPDGINHILSEYDFSKDEVLFVGDSPLDQGAAINSGVKFVFFDNPDDNYVIESKYSISNHFELENIIKQFEKN